MKSSAREPVYLPEITVRWGGQLIRVRPARSHYLNHDAVAITADADGKFGREPYGTVSVNLPEPPAGGCIWVKTWAENEGLLEQLVNLGLLELTGREQYSGWVNAPEAKLIGDWAMS